MENALTGVAGKKFILSYSCGKDSTLCLHKMLEAGAEPMALLVMFNPEAGRSYFHGVDPALLKEYGEALELPLLAVPTGGEEYHLSMEAALRRAKEQGVELVCFGDIDIENNRAWGEERCRNVGLEAVYPLWHHDRQENVREVLDLGYRCLIKTLDRRVLPRQLLGRELKLAPTAIDRYYQCPYQFFCDKMLRLRPRQRVEFSPFESGSAIHYVFQQMVNQYGSRGLCELTDEEMDGEIRRFLREYIDRMVPDPANVTARFRYQFDRLRLMLGVIVRHLADEFSQSEFTAAATEVSVGEGGEVASPRLSAGDGTPISLRGSIDRVDLYHGPEGDYLRVIDYKSGTKEFRFEEVPYGLNMQMLIYLYAACGDENHRFGSPQPAGVLYLPSRLEALEVTMDTTSESLAAEVNECCWRMRTSCGPWSSSWPGCISPPR